MNVNSRTDDRLEKVLRSMGMIGLLAFFILVIVACGEGAAPAATPTPTIFAITKMPEITPAIQVVDQEILNGTVTIPEVVSKGQGWLVIHAQEEDKPGPALGFTKVASGVNQNVTVEIDVSQATETLFAMLHSDAGRPDEFELGGYDLPVKVDGQVLALPFKVTGGLP